MAGKGHEERLPPSRSSGCCRLGQQTFARTHGNERHAPIPVVCGTEVERQGSTLGGLCLQVSVTVRTFPIVLVPIVWYSH